MSCTQVTCEVPLICELSAKYHKQHQQPAELRENQEGLIKRCCHDTGATREALHSPPGLLSATRGDVRVSSDTFKATKCRRVAGREAVLYL